ncbi:uncharacterized protein IUM83_01722 [Phytophthora cinnamomi]|uniref:uncharacterized protein n=1 Tax=Phytophthora cinnamomi TaxID=4785 RepID=UPI00355AC8DD|nr:hypothetical protein IUM83_01722 [Phytophthora cinnamomi]
MLCESVNQHDNALSFYQAAMKSLKAVNAISVRCVVGIKLMDQMGKCYHYLGRHEPTEKLFKKVVRLYEKYRGEFSENAPSRSNDHVMT